MLTTARQIVAVVIVNFRSSELIARNYRLFGPPGYLVVIVDNYSDEDERARIRGLCDDRGFIFVPLDHNLGFGHGANAGAETALALGASVLVFLNPDAEPSPQLVEDLAIEVVHDPKTIVCPKVVDLRGVTRFSGAYLYPRSGRVRNWTSPRKPSQDGAPTTWLTGACLGVGEAAWRKLGGFRTEYFMYWEDVDFSFRAEMAGFKLRVRSDLVLRHDQGGTQQGPEASRSELYYRYNIRNRLLFAATNLPRAQLRLWLMSTPAVAWEVVTDGGRRQLLEHPTLIRGALRGLAEGVAVASLRLMKATMIR